MTTHVQAVDLKAKLFRGFADPSRLAILLALTDGVRTVNDLVVATGLSQSNTSNHLSCLYECGLVTREQQGRFVYYALRDARVGMLLSLADELVMDIAKGIYECTRYPIPTSIETQE